ncbi:hypothetical protein IT408_04450 [Candidatus Uhrbacteria bacterium]|nr:hypothetical protein [Candidatus Uhrbacteria bacterium]
MPSSSVIVAYIPVLHEGYRRFFLRHSNTKDLYIFGEDLIKSYEQLVKDIRGLKPELIQSAIASWNLFEKVHILDEQTIQELKKNNISLIISDDDVNTELIKKYFPHHPVQTDTIFLRWDKKNSIKPMQISPDIEISESVIDKKMIEQAIEQGKHSPDWWRRIGAIAVKNGTIILKTNNTYVPSDQIANDEGDPRSNFSKGINLESSLAIHAEARLIAEAAKQGLALQDAEIYCDTFPCPPCAKQLAYAGISKLYYRNGYAVLDGERILKSQGVRIIFVKP